MSQRQISQPAEATSPGMIPCIGLPIVHIYSYADTTVTNAPDVHSTPRSSAMAGPEGPSTGTQQSVRFAPQNLEIEPSGDLRTGTTAAEAMNIPAQARRRSSSTNDELRNLSHSLQKSRLQESRLHNFVFDPVSLPASRVRITYGPRGSQGAVL